MDRIAFKQLSAGSLFKIGYVCLFGFVMPLAILAGLLAMGGADTVSLNGRPVHGLGGLVAAIGLGFVMPAILAAFMTLGGLVMRLFGRLLPALALRGGLAA